MLQNDSKVCWQKKQIQWHSKECWEGSRAGECEQWCVCGGLRWWFLPLWHPPPGQLGFQGLTEELATMKMINVTKARGQTAGNTPQVVFLLNSKGSVSLSWIYQGGPKYPTMDWLGHFYMVVLFGGNSELTVMLYSQDFCLMNRL